MEAGARRQVFSRDLLNRGEDDSGEGKEKYVVAGTKPADRKALRILRLFEDGRSGSEEYVEDGRYVLGLIRGRLIRGGWGI